MGVKTKIRKREVRIEYMRLDEIQRDLSNPKDHALSALAESLERFGFVSPMGINEKTGKLLWGHGRLDDLIAVMDEGKPALEGIQVDDDGMWKAPVVRGVHLNSKDGTAYLISDNAQVIIGGWNEPKLVETLIRIAGEDGFGLRGTGYDGDDVDALIRLYRPDLLNLPEDPGPQIDRAAELQEKWGTELGQIWELGDHRLAVGDCTDKAVVDAVMMGERAGAVVTDPPYGIERDGVPNDEPDGLQDLYNGCLTSMPIDNAVIIVFQSPRLFWIWLDELKKASQHIERILWWFEPFTPASRTRAYPWRGWYMQGEVILVSSIGEPGWPHSIDFVSDTYQHDFGDERVTEQGSIKETWHPTLKPLWVVEDLIKHTLGDIYEPFSGSGTGLIACQRLNRRCRAIEIHPPYAAVTIQRWVDMTSLEPRLVTP